MRLQASLGVVPLLVLCTYSHPARSNGVWLTPDTSNLAIKRDIEFVNAEGSSDVASDAWSDQVLSEHNAARARYGAGPLTWNAALYPDTLQYAQQCKLASSDSKGKYGENLYANSRNTTGINNAVSSWMSQAAKYDYNKPGFSSATGGFTQVVWKNTTQVTCAIADCPPNTVLTSFPAKFIVCRYTPPGNINGRFPQNVGMPVAT